LLSFKAKVFHCRNLKFTLVWLRLRPVSPSAGHTQRWRGGREEIDAKGRVIASVARHQ
jgi:hypothetical protein